MLPPSLAGPRLTEATANAPTAHTHLSAVRRRAISSDSSGTGVPGLRATREVGGSRHGQLRRRSACLPLWPGPPGYPSGRFVAPHRPPAPEPENGNRMP
jgi:hypothetical protein